MATVQRWPACLLGALALAGVASIAAAQESSPTDPGTRLVVFEDFTRFT